MATSPQRSSVIVVDNVDIDNLVAARTAFYRLLGLNPVAVIVTGRPANRDRRAPIHVSDPVYSRQVLQGNTRRMKGVLARAGVDIPVFEGLIPPYTVVPHFIHVDEEANLDLHGDFLRVRADGQFQQAMDFLDRLKGPIDFIVGGPFTEVAAIMENRRLAPRLGILTCQAGLFGFGDVRTMADGGITFNSAADPKKIRAVLKKWRGPLYMVPTDVTKQRSVGIDTPRDLDSFGVHGELAQLWEVFYREAKLKERRERIYPHDVHAVFLMAQLHGRLKGLKRRLYTLERVRIDNVGPQGEIGATFNTPSSGPPRYVVKAVDSPGFQKLLVEALYAAP